MHSSRPFLWHHYAGPVLDYTDISTRHPARSWPKLNPRCTSCLLPSTHVHADTLTPRSQPRQAVCVWDLLGTCSTRDAAQSPPINSCQCALLMLTLAQQRRTRSVAHHSCTFGGYPAYCVSTDARKRSYLHQRIRQATQAAASQQLAPLSHQPHTHRPPPTLPLFGRPHPSGRKTLQQGPTAYSSPLPQASF